MNKLLLKDRVEFVYGFSVRVNNEKIGEYPIFGSNGPIGFIDSFKVSGPGVIIGRKGSVGKVNFTEKNFTPTDTTYYLQIKNPKTDNLKFWYYYLPLLGLEKLNTHSSVPGLSREVAYLISVSPLDLFSQQKIASVLSTLDSKIELNNKINTELEAMAKTLYDYWFVQFDFPNESGKPYKSNGGEMVYNENLKRDIPKGWEVENLKKNSITTLIKPNIDRFEGEKIYLATADVEKNIININANKITYQKRESRANMQPSENSIWFAKMKNSKKILSFFDYSKEYLQNFVLSTGFAGLKCKKNAMEYLWNFINNQNFEFIKNRLANGATQEAINNDSMAFIPLIIPNKNTVDIYHEKTYDIYKKIYINQLENQKLAEIRDWLLPMLMNGQVKVTDDNK